MRLRRSRRICSVSLRAIASVRAQSTSAYLCCRFGRVTRQRHESIFETRSDFLEPRDVDAMRFEMLTQRPERRGLFPHHQVKRVAEYGGFAHFVDLFDELNCATQRLAFEED